MLNLKLITLNLPEAYIDGIEKLIEEDLYPNRAEVIRMAVRDFIIKETNFKNLLKSN